MINSQLLDSLNEPGGVPSALIELTTQFTDLWKKANDRADQTTPLLLLIDGLDEIADEEITIVDRLPTVLNDYVHLVITSRPNPKPQQHIPAEHPFSRPKVVPLEPFDDDDIKKTLSNRSFSQPITPDLIQRIRKVTEGVPIYVHFICEDIAANGISALQELEKKLPDNIDGYFQTQLQKLYETTAKETTTWQILGLLSAAIGGMTHEELSDILKVFPSDIRKACKPIARFLKGEKRYELMHGLFRRALEKELPHRVSPYEQQLLNWCKSYQAQQWPATTPDYVLEHFVQHLEDDPDHESLYKLVDRRWMELKYERTGAHESFARDMEHVSFCAANANPPDWEPLVGSVLASSTIISSSRVLDGWSLLRALIFAGESKKACLYADLVQSDENRLSKYTEIAIECIKIGEFNVAVAKLKQAAHIARQSVKELQKKAAWIDDSIKDLDVAQMAIKLAEVSDFQASILHLKNLRSIPILAWTKLRIAQQMYRAGEKELALAQANEALNKAVGSYDNIIVYNRIWPEAKSLGVKEKQNVTYTLGEIRIPSVSKPDITEKLQDIE
ncbi:MAG: hypothetical protein U0175_09320 [Caldilineaceae bacterium]